MFDVSRVEDLAHLKSLFYKETNPLKRNKYKSMINKLLTQNKDTVEKRAYLVNAIRNNRTGAVKEISSYLFKKNGGHDVPDSN